MTTVSAWGPFPEFMSDGSESETTKASIAMIPKIVISFL